MKLKQIIWSVIGSFIAASASAEMVKFADFEQYNNGQVVANSVAVSTDGWTKSTDANNKSFLSTVFTNDLGNKYLLHDKTGAAGGYATVAQTTSQGLATGFYATTADDGYQTLFFRFMVDSSQGTNGYIGVGIAADASIANPLIKCGFKVDGAGHVLDADLAEQATIQLDTWYNAWLTVDHRGTSAGSNAKLYLQSDDDATFSSQALVGSSFYKNPGAVPYKTLLFTSEHINGLNLALDDLYYDNPGSGVENLENPLSPTSPPYGYEKWANEWAVDIGAETNDFDEDQFNNFFEYVFNGDPTNSAVSGENIMLESDAGNLICTYVQRNDDTNLIYTLETAIDLIDPSWTNLGYTVVGTNVTAGAYDYVTHSISTTGVHIFVRLKVGQ